MSEKVCKLKFIKKTPFGNERYFPQCDLSKSLVKLKERAGSFTVEDMKEFDKFFEIEMLAEGWKSEN
jgi:hypothetical protein